MGATAIPYATRTWEPVSGCTPLSEGCVRCWAAALAKGRLRRFYPEGFEAVRTHPARLEEPLHWRKPQIVFVCSRCDLFHENVPESFLDAVLQVISMAAEYEMGHTFLLLTKRPHRMEYWLEYVGEQPNIWVGVTVENQVRAEERIPLLLQTPAAKRWVSAEPLLSSLYLGNYLYGVDWVIAGAESGPGARPAREEWFRNLRDQCRAAGVPYYLKQMMLDGRTWREVPEMRERKEGPLMPSCPHCSEKIERLPKVHYEIRTAFCDDNAACGVYVPMRHREERLTTDRSQVTCLSCRKTRVFKEGK